MKKLALMLSFAMLLGVISVNAQVKKVDTKKTTIEQSSKAPADKEKIVKKIEKKDVKKAPAKKEAAAPLKK